MSWEGMFALANGWALIVWIVLILGPRGQRIEAFVLMAGVGLLCLVYVLLLASITGGVVDPAGPGEGGAQAFTTIEGVRAIFASDGGMVVGWVHYLALDMLAGLWIARAAEARDVSRRLQAPVLLLTFMAGPAGLLAWLVISGFRRKGATR